MDITNIISDFFTKLHEKYNPDEGNEHTYRTPLQNFLDSVSSAIDTNIEARQEVNIGSSDLGVPDFSFINNKHVSHIGLLENKAIGINIEKLIDSKQIQKYRKHSDNIILTNYLQWIRLYDGNITHNVTLATKQQLIDGEPPNDESLNGLKDLLTAFLSTDPLGVGDTKTLASHLAVRCHDLRDFLTNILTQQNKAKDDTPLTNLYDAFQQYVDENLSIEDFADSFSQTLGYSAFLAKLNNQYTTINLYNITQFIPENFPLIKSLSDFLSQLDKDIYNSIKHRIDEILAMINHADIAQITEELAGKKQLFLNNDLDPRIARDPFIYFYEHFLHEYDADKKRERGVYYTPPSVVNFIIRGIDHILKNNLNISEGFAAAEQVQVLDFATGTGTFLHEAISHMLDDDAIKNNPNMKEALVKDHILENFYGFEYLMAPYAIAHLKLSQLLRDNGFDIAKTKQAFKIYLANTLAMAMDKSKTSNYPFMQELKKESDNAYDVKDKSIRVIMGNPPYSCASQNKGEIDVLIKKAYKPSNETKLNWDDYVKFIYFAHQKMESIDKGVIGIITNNSFLNAITLRQMRNSLMQDFNAIYILNLHGNSIIGDVTDDGKVDKNIFGIRVGVCVTFLVKTELKPQKCEVFYASIKSSSQTDKWQKILTSDFDIFQPLNVQAFNRKLSATRWKNRFEQSLSFFVPMESVSGKLIAQYGDFWGVTDIFQQYGSGVKTERDHISIHQTKKEIQTVVNDFIQLAENKLDEKYQKAFGKTDSRDWSIKRAKADIEKHIGQNLYQNILFRPFDLRKTYYTGTSKGFIGTPGTKIASHMLAGENYGFAFSRLVEHDNEYTEFGIIDALTDIHYIGGQSYVTPLYLYPIEIKENQIDDAFAEKTENFKPDFRQWVKEKYGKHYTPEDILGYIYAVLHSPTFRKTYQELLKIDFPRIPFIDGKNTFEKMATLGWQLIQAHLMKTNLSTKSQLQGKGSGKVEQSPKYVDDKQHLYINASQYFDKIPLQVWEFKIGGYSVLDKYLKERKKEDRKLTLAELQHIPKIVATLDFTLTQMVKIDKAFTCP